MAVEDLVEKVKENLILSHDEDDNFIARLVETAIAYAESYQHLDAGFYSENDMSSTTEQAVIMLSSYLYESRDGSTGGFFSDSTSAAVQVWDVVNTLLRLDREWSI